MNKSKQGRPIKSPFKQKRKACNLTLAPACMAAIKKLADRQGMTRPDWIEQQVWNALQQEKQHATQTRQPNKAQDSNDHAVQ